MTLEERTNSEEETIALGNRLGKTVQAGDIILLQGDLGVGKSCLARGIARGLGADESMPMRSPTFALIHDYDLRLPLRHADLYRIDNPDEIEHLGLFDEMTDTRVTVIEWGERLPPKLRRCALVVTINDCGATQRIVRTEPYKNR